MSIMKLKEREYSINRLLYLKNKHPEVSEILNFLEKILRWQLGVSERLENQAEKDWRKHTKDFYSLLDLCITYGSELLRDTAERLKGKSREEVEKMVGDFLKEKQAPDEERFILLSFLNPYFSSMAEDNIKDWFKEKCPVCGFRPSVSYIMDTEEVEGARFLSCVLCHTSWLYNRTKCVRCGNVDDEHFEYFYDQESRYIQLQVCKKCNTYMKLIDLRVDGLAVPHIDDVATLSLDLWAREKGFERYERNILGL